MLYLTVTRLIEIYEHYQLCASSDNGMINAERHITE